MTTLTLLFSGGYYHDKIPYIYVLYPYENIVTHLNFFLTMSITRNNLIHT